MTDREELSDEIERVRREAEEIKGYVKEREESIRKGVRKAKTYRSDPLTLPHCRNPAYPR